MNPVPRPLSVTDQILVREGILVEYAPGYTLEADYARIGALRGAAVRRLTRRKYNAVTRTALWIHTGRHIPDEPVRLTLSHPSTATPFNVSRRRILPHNLTDIGGMSLTIPSTTCVDFLILESPELALTAIEILLEAKLVTPPEIEAKLAEEHSRNGARRAKQTWRSLCLST